MSTETIVTCESCNLPIFPKNEDVTKRFPVKYKKFDTLCQTCYNVERTAFENTKPIMQQPVEVIVTKREEFFNAERTDIGLLQGTAFEKVIAIRERIDKWKDLLFEIRTRQESAQSELQKLAAGITQEERDKLKISDVNYVPGSAGTPKPKVVRMSAAEKSEDTMMRALFGHEIKTGKISEAEARIKIKELVRNSKAITFTKMASGEIKCSCSETPGICKVHST